MAEEDIIKGCIKNDGASQRALFGLYAGKLMSICLRYGSTTPEAEDMLQEAFIRIFTYIQQYKGEGPFEGWLKRITVNTCLRILQKNKIRFTDIAEADVHSHAVNTEHLDGLNENELLKLVSSLPAGYRLVFNLYVLEGYSHEEIGGLLNIEAATSRSQLVKARKMLQKKILSLQKIAI